jgi:hypothetical protein
VEASLGGLSRRHWQVLNVVRQGRASYAEIDARVRPFIGTEGITALVLFSQDYARELSDETYGIYNFNWGYYLNSLKQFVEKNSGVPFVPPA